MRFFSERVFILFVILSCGHQLLAQGNAQDKYPSNISPISKDHSYVHKNKAYHYWALSPHLNGQKTSSSCSVASVTMVINAIRTSQKLLSEEPLATEALTLEKANQPEWTSRTDESTLPPDKTKGVPLDLLQTYIHPALSPWKIEIDRIEVVHIDSLTKEELEKWRKDLQEFESNKMLWIISNFDQGLLMHDKPVGHVSPIAAYDKLNKRVLVMDTDKAWYEPYWTSDEDLFKAMGTWGTEFQRNRGYLKIYIKNLY